jgi:dephospho-CoA kinase
MKVIALTGGIGAGKSTARGILITITLLLCIARAQKSELTQISSINGKAYCQ